MCCRLISCKFTDGQWWNPPTQRSLNWVQDQVVSTLNSFIHFSGCFLKGLWQLSLPKQQQNILALLHVVNSVKTWSHTNHMLKTPWGQGFKSPLYLAVIWKAGYSSTEPHATIGTNQMKHDLGMSPLTSIPKSTVRRSFQHTLLSRSTDNP